MSKYRDYEQSRQSFGINVLGTLVVEVEAENGQTGFAVSTAGEMGCFIVEKHLNRFIEGKCVSDIKLIHDQMLSATLYYSGSGGLVMNTISCVDLALWDLFGKVVGLPVYKLLGGAVRDEIQFYATGARPDLAKEMGFIGGKMPTHWGPHDGDAGIRKDAAMVADMREKCGEDFWLMLDCWMSQDVNYATKLAHACAPYNLKWIEECLPPQQYESYRELKRNAPVGMMVTSGEHHGTLQSFRTLSETGIDIMQPDVGWCGGLTTLVEIAAIAKSRGQLVVPHGSSVYSHHAVITFTNTPFSEFLMTSPDCSTMRPQFDPILLNEPVPVNGRIHKSVLDKPGFGVELKYILLTESQSDGGMMLRFVLRSETKLAQLRKALPWLQEQLPQLKVITVNIQPVHMAIMEGETEIYLTEQQALAERFNDVPLWVRPQSFFQTNPAVASQLYATARDWVRQLPVKHMWDLFCGVGGFGLHCATPDMQLTGIEIAPEAIACAKQSAAELGLTRLQFQALDSTQFATAQGEVPELVLVNPPRRGIGKPLCDYLSTMAPRFIIYSSCNAQTMAKDIRELPGYRIERVQLFDMFPHTAHYEVLTLLVKM